MKINIKGRIQSGFVRFAIVRLLLLNLNGPLPIKIEWWNFKDLFYRERDGMWDERMIDCILRDRDKLIMFTIYGGGKVSFFSAFFFFVFCSLY